MKAFQKMKTYNSLLKEKIPFSKKSLSVLTNPATKALGRAATQSSRLRSVGIAPKTLLKRCSLAYIAAAVPLCPSNSCSEKNYYYQSHSTTVSGPQPTQIKFLKSTTKKSTSPSPSPSPSIKQLIHTKKFVDNQISIHKLQK